MAEQTNRVVRGLKDCDCDVCARVQETFPVCPLCDVRPGEDRVAVFMRGAQLGVAVGTFVEQCGLPDGALTATSLAALCRQHAVAFFETARALNLTSSGGDNVH